MARNINIIELYGLPGCGKTTLRNSLVNGKRECKTTFCLQSTHTDMFRNRSVFYFIRYIPFKTWWYVLLLTFRFPCAEKSKLYRLLFSITFTFHKAKDFDGYDYIVIDHGLIQGIVGLMTGKRKSLPEKNIPILRQLFSTIDNVNFVYCHIAPSVSQSRIRSRGRNSGRLDLIVDESKQYELLSIQKQQFDALYNLLNEICDNRSIKLDMEATPEEIQCELLAKINKR